jgi:hypothetical protein
MSTVMPSSTRPDTHDIFAHALIFAPMSVDDSTSCRIIVFGSIASGPTTSHACWIVVVRLPCVTVPFAGSADAGSGSEAAVAAARIIVVRRQAASVRVTPIPGQRRARSGPRDGPVQVFANAARAAFSALASPFFR